MWYRDGGLFKDDEVDKEFGINYFHIFASNSRKMRTVTYLNSRTNASLIEISVSYCIDTLTMVFYLSPVSANYLNNIFNKYFSVYRKFSGTESDSDNESDSEERQFESFMESFRKTMTEARSVKDGEKCRLNPLKKYIEEFSKVYIPICIKNRCSNGFGIYYPRNLDTQQMSEDYASIDRLIKSCKKKYPLLPLRVNYGRYSRTFCSDYRDKYKIQVKKEKIDDLLRSINSFYFNESKMTNDLSEDLIQDLRHLFCYLRDNIFDFMGDSLPQPTSLIKNLQNHINEQSIGKQRNSLSSVLISCIQELTCRDITHNHQDRTLIFLKLLSHEKVDLNQEVNGCLPLLSAIQMDDLETFNLLLAYEADLLKRPLQLDPFPRYNAMELITTSNKDKFLNLVGLYLSSNSLERRSRISNQQEQFVSPQIPQTKTKPKIEIYRNGREIHTTLDLGHNRKFTTRLMTMEDYAQNPALKHIRSDVETIYYNSFEDSQGDMAFFKGIYNDSIGHSFSNPPQYNKWIEILVEQGKTVGFFIFQTIIVQDVITVKTEDAAVIDDFAARYKGVNFLLGRRLAYAIKLLQHEHIVAGHCIAISYFTYRMMEGEKYCTPKKQSPNMLELNIAIVNHGNKGDSIVIQHGFYIEERSLPKVRKSTPNVTFNQQFYSEFMLMQRNLSFFLKQLKDPNNSTKPQDTMPNNQMGILETKSNSESATPKLPFTRGAVMTTIIDKISFNNFSSELLARIGLDFKPHCIDLACALLENRETFLPLFKDKLTKPADLSTVYDQIKNDSSIFWGSASKL